MAAKDEQLYRENSQYRLVFRTHDELVAFAKLLEKLPIPHVVDEQYMTLRYYPSASRLKVEAVIDQTHFYRFNYFYLNQENGVGKIEQVAEKDEILDTKVTLSESKKIVALTQFKQPWEGHMLYSCWLDMDGWLVMLGVRNDSVDLSKQSIKDVFSVVTFEEKFQWS